MKVLHIVSSAYRATLEEQDDTVLWFTQAMKGAGAEVDVLLRGPAVNYVIEGQEAQPLSFGARTQKHGPDVHGQVRALHEKGVAIFVDQSDLERRGVVMARKKQGKVSRWRGRLAGGRWGGPGSGLPGPRGLVRRRRASTMRVGRPRPDRPRPERAVAR